MDDPVNDLASHPFRTCRLASKLTMGIILTNTRLDTKMGRPDISQTLQYCSISPSIPQNGLPEVHFNIQKIVLIIKYGKLQIFESFYSSNIPQSNFSFYQRENSTFRYFVQDWFYTRLVISQVQFARFNLTSLMILLDHKLYTIQATVNMVAESRVGDQTSKNNCLELSMLQC